jgi:hypothetical protein
MNSVVNDRYSIERKQTLALVHLRHLDAAGIRCDMSPATDYDKIQIRYDAWQRDRSQPATPARVDRVDFLDPFSPIAIKPERLDTGGSDEGGAVVIDDPSSALLERQRHQWKAQRRGPRRQFAGRRDDGPGAYGSSPDAEDDTPAARGKGDDSMPANKLPSRDNPYENVTFSEANKSVPLTPRAASEHGRSAFGGGNEGDNAGDFGNPPMEFDDDGGATKDAQDRMLKRQQDAWKRGPRARK